MKLNWFGRDYNKKCDIVHGLFVYMCVCTFFGVVELLSKVLWRLI
jgi:hypothetical protein